ncbi:Transcriptional regulatory protein YycF [compost metagenome]
MTHHILLIEDDISIVEMLNGYLSKEGFQVTSAMDGEDGIIAFRQHSFDLIVVDLMMPKLDGIEVIKIIRESSLVPILIMSAKDNDIDKAIGLGFGADDYIAKPFSMIEITARIKASIRRATQYTPLLRGTLSNTESEPVSQIITIDNLNIDLNNYTVTRHGEEIKLTSKETDILKLFLNNPNRVFTKAQIYSFVWNEEYYGDENVINVHIRRLREKLEDQPSEPKYIKTLWGIGYKWEGHSR